MLEKYGRRMNETMFDHWFGIVNKWAMELSSFDNPPAPTEEEIYETPINTSDRTTHNVEDSTTMSR